MGTTAFVALLAVTTIGASIPTAEAKKQDEAFQNWWSDSFVWEFDELPDNGSVAEFRVPYSGHIYPDTAGGTTRILHKYDRAFNGWRGLAASHERWDTTAFKEPMKRRGLFGREIVTRRMRTPEWHGHCNGWTAAAIRHAEPQQSVTRNGVVFTPADIKGLLAEIYIYNDHTVLAGEDSPLNPGTFHALLANWIGRGKYPVAMEADPSKEKWNYPIYAYACTSGRRSDRQIEVKTNIAYAKDSQGEFHQSPRIKEVKYFHYMLNLDSSGRIVGGYWLRDSSIIDMIWVPVSPKPSGRTGNERGNPYVDVNKVLGLWQASVPQDVRNKWLNIDPTEEHLAVSIAAQNELAEADEAEQADEDPEADGGEEELTASRPRSIE